ncbi:MAG: LPS export ABC transporter permease LptG [Hyphomonas sp.]|nr:LPS export ABC transporter permease LptG [Hyphomonas sp.]MCB9971442.1 LPS export ABC transporter permease LptG [Hyphomonas sp.]
MPFVSRIQLYILRECLAGLVLVLGILLVAILMIDVVEQLRTVGGDVNLSLLGALRLSLMKLPQIMEQTLPFALLIASMMAFTRLNRRSELSIIRASGISAWRFLAPVMALGFIIGLFATTLLNPFAARLSESFEVTRAGLLDHNRQAMAVSNTGIWLRQGDDTSQIVIHAKHVEQGGVVLRDVKMIEEERLYSGSQPTSDFAFSRRIDADRATLRDGFWQLENVVENVPNQPPDRKPALTIPSSLDASTLLDRFASPNTIGFWKLPEFIKQTRAAGLDVSRYRMRWHQLMAMPALFVAMALIGAVVCLRLQRMGGTSQLLAIGTLAAIGLYFFTQFSSSLGATGAAPPVVAAWSPPLFVLFCTLAYIAYREDG